MHQKESKKWRVSLPASVLFSVPPTYYCSSKLEAESSFFLHAFPLHKKKQMTGKIFVDFCSIGGIARQLCNCVYFCKTKLLNLRTQTNQLVIYIGTVLGNMSNLSEPKRGVVPAAASIPLKKTKTARK